MDQQGFVHVILTPAASDALVDLAADFSAVLGKRVTTAEALLIVRGVLTRHHSPALLATEILLSAIEAGIVD